MNQQPRYGRQWRDYRTATGRRPVREFIDAIRAQDRYAAARFLAGMNEVAQYGTSAARHLRGDIWEVRVVSSVVGLPDRPIALLHPSSLDRHTVAAISFVIS